jgi:serine protease AprX
MTGDSTITAVSERSNGGLMRLHWIGRRLATFVAAGGLVLAGAGAAVLTGQAAAQAAGAAVAVIVRHDGSGAARDAAEDAVRRAGGRVGQRLELVDSFTARVPGTTLEALRRTPGVLAVTEDGSLRMAGKQWTADPTSTSMYSVTQQVGAQTVWGKLDPSGRKVTGKGVGVALIDSGIAPVKGLNTPARVINGPDLSLEAPNANLRHLDTFGHGTHMAGIILGRDPEVVAGKENANPAQFVGVAPDANLINLKVATADGAVDVSQVIAAIEWVVKHRNDTGLNIKVLNLSFGTDSVQDARLDPLSHAVETAWRNGIVVVVAVGNNGATATRLSMPAMNPYIIAVGASDTLGTTSRADDVVASFSSKGSTVRKPDLVAPGKSIVSLRDPQSYVDVNYPGGLVADGTGRFFKGSGSSQAAAVTSGAAALLLQHRPGLTPDQVKRLLTSTATAMPAADSTARGAGQLDINAALSAVTPTTGQTFAASTGTGKLDASRGTARLADPTNGVELTGERDIMNKGWPASTWATGCTNQTNWSGGSYNGSTWTGGGWTTSPAWASKTWSAAAWSGSNWANQGWSNSTATASSTSVWDGRTWSGRTWSGRTWSGRTWSGGYWSSRTWQ